MSRIAAPGAKRVTFLGLMAAPDTFGRLRVMILDELADGTKCYSHIALQRAAAAATLPFTLAEPDRDGVRGVAVLAVPARHRRHWLAEAERLRSQEVRVEATLRPYNYEAPDGTRRAGLALDVAAIDPLI